MSRHTLLLAAALLLPDSTSGMIWHPKNPKNSMWDTWLYASPDAAGIPKYYMNYLSSCDGSCGGSPSSDPAGCCGWNGVGATISSDGVHYEDQGIVITKDDGAAWLGSGSVLKNSDGEYVMNFSEEYDCQPANPKAKYGTDCQSIFFATSKDLKNWTRVPFKPPPANDTEVFKYTDGGYGGTNPGYAIGGRWDCIATIPKPGSPGIFYGFWTASPTGSGGVGIGETTDQTGHHWKALAPLTAGFPSAELGSTVVLGGKYYLLFGGGHIYSSDNPILGYKPDPKNAAFHVDGDGVAFTRLWNVQGSGNEGIVLISHQWMTDGMTGSGFPGAMGSKGIYLAPLKQMKVGADGTPRVVYWSGNEALKGAAIAVPSLPPPAPPAPPPPPVERVDVAACDGTTWTVPAVGAAASPIALKTTSTSTSTNTTLSTPPSPPPPPPTGYTCAVVGGTGYCEPAGPGVKGEPLATCRQTCGHAPSPSPSPPPPSPPSPPPPPPPPPGPPVPPGSACLDIENGTDVLVLSSCSSGAAKFAVLANGSITSGQGCGIVPKTSYKFAPGNVFPDNSGPHGVRITDSVGQCCALCQSLKNCSFFTFSHGGANPTCYGMPGSCCFLKTAAAEGGGAPDAGSTSGTNQNVPYCMDGAPPALSMAPCDSTSVTQDWTTAGGTLREAKSAAPSGQCLSVSSVPAPPLPPSPGMLFDLEVDLTVGVVIEATLSCANSSTSAGFWVHGSSDDATFVWNCGTQTFTVGGSQIDRKPGFAAGAPIALKMLLRSTPNGRRGMAEFYANEIMSHPFTFNVGGGNAAKVGVAADLHNGDLKAVTAVKAWKMTLSNDQESIIP